MVQRQRGQSAGDRPVDEVSFMADLIDEHGTAGATCAAALTSCVSLPSQRATVQFTIASSHRGGTETRSSLARRMLDSIAV